MNVMEQCPVCGKRGIIKQVCYDSTAVFYECPVCGRYEYSMENNAYEELDYNELAPFLFYEGFRNPLSYFLPNAQTKKEPNQWLHVL